MILKPALATLLATATTLAIAQAQPSPAPPPLEEYALYADEIPTGTSIRRKTAIGSRLPFRARFHELSPQHKAYLRAHYERMPDTDEPPYPRHGLIDIYKGMTAIQQAKQVDGQVEMYVTVSASGKPTQVQVFQTPNAEVGELMASVLMLVDYKPAVCGGQPCAMEFPFIVQLRRSL